MDLLSHQIYKELFLKIAAGEAAAFRTLFNNYRKKIYSFAFSFTKSEFLAEEVVQEVFYKVWLHKGELKKVEYPEAWMKTIARNTASNYLKRWAHERLIIREMTVQNSESEEMTIHTLEWKEYRAAVDKAIKSLPPQQRRVYLLSRQEGFKYQEIADEMQLSIHTVKEYIKKALFTIRLQLSRYAGLVIMLTSLMLIR